MQAQAQSTKLLEYRDEIFEITVTALPDVRPPRLVSTPLGWCTTGGPEDLRLAILWVQGEWVYVDLSLRLYGQPETTRTARFQPGHDGEWLRQVADRLMQEILEDRG